MIALLAGIIGSIGDVITGSDDSSYRDENNEKENNENNEKKYKLIYNRD